MEVFNSRQLLLERIYSTRITHTGFCAYSRKTNSYEQRDALSIYGRKHRSSCTCLVQKLKLLRPTIFSYLLITYISIPPPSINHNTIPSSRSLIQLDMPLTLTLTSILALYTPNPPTTNIPVRYSHMHPEPPEHGKALDPRLLS